MFGDSISGACQKCDKNCLTCDGSTAFNCTSCSKSLALRTDKQCGNCTVGTFLRDSNNKCEECDISCASCATSSFTCISCRNASFYKENEVCLNCPSGCFTCVNSTYCKSCQSGFLKKGNSCQVDCSEVFLRDVSEENMDCHPCDIDQYYDFELSTCVQRHYCITTGLDLTG